MMHLQSQSHTIPQSMIESKFPALRWQKAARENRSITLKEIADETNLSMGTIHRLSKGDIKGVRIETLEALCKYFGVGIADIIEYKND